MWRKEKEQTEDGMVGKKGTRRAGSYLANQ
jgi:hypothetical protein